MPVALLENPPALAVKASNGDELMKEFTEWSWESEYTPKPFEGNPYMGAETLAKLMKAEQQKSVAFYAWEGSAATSAPEGQKTVYAQVYAQVWAENMLSPGTYAKTPLPGASDPWNSMCPCPACVARREAYIRESESRPYVLTDADLLVYLVKVGERGNLGVTRNPADCFLARVLSAKYPHIMWRVGNDEVRGASRIYAAGLRTYAFLLSTRQRAIVRCFDACPHLTDTPVHEPVARDVFLKVWNERTHDPILIDGDQARFLRGPETPDRHMAYPGFL